MLAGMSTWQYTLIVVLGIILLLNIVITRGLVRDSSISPSQRAVQFLIIWIVPGVGAIAVYAAIAHHHTKDEMRKLFPFPFYLIYREPIAPGGYGDSNPFGEGGCGGDAT